MIRPLRIQQRAKRSGMLTAGSWSTPSFWRKGWMLFALILFLPLLAGCATQSAASGDDELRVVATTGMIADVARQIGGDSVQVDQLMGPGVDPHLYKATEGDVSTLLAADLILYNGLFLEARMEDIFEQMSGDKRTVAVAAASVPVEMRLGSVQYVDQFDPHVWMDVKLWKRVAETIQNELIALDPDNEDGYRSRADAYFAEMDRLETWINERIATLPPEKRLLVTAHDAFNYFGQGYGFEVFAPQGISTESEAGVDDIRRTIDVVVESQIPAIFIESSIPPDVVEAIVEGARARGHEVTIGGELFSDAMGEEGTEEGTYLGMIRHNVETITSALSAD